MPDIPLGAARPLHVVPELLLQPCEELPLARDGRLSSLLKNHVEVVQAYELCADRHGALVGWLRKRPGLKGTEKQEEAAH